MTICLILAAGYATRLYPLTENFPKPLLKVGEKTILDWLIDDLGTSVDEYAVVTNHRFAAKFSEWATSRSEKITVFDDGTETNETRLGAVRDIQFAVERLHCACDLLIAAGDNLLDFSLRDFVAYAREKGASCIMRYEEPSVEKLQKCGVVTVDEADRVLRMTEKSKNPETHWCCPPFYYYIEKDACRVAESIAEGCGVDAPGSFAAWLCARTAVYAMKMPGKRYDIGNLESYEKVKKEYRGICRKLL